SATEFERTHVYKQETHQTKREGLSCRRRDEIRKYQMLHDPSQAECSMEGSAPIGSHVTWRNSG
ncbi:hypothetical protein KI387_005318, partial [Taxus chinensis]